MKLGYNTNSMAHHDPIQAIGLLAELGFRSVALTIDHGLLNPRDANFRDQLVLIRETLQRHQMASVIETGARFLLDPTVKHAPTLLDDDDDKVKRRVAFLCHCIDMAAELNSDCVSLWSGAVPAGCDDEQAMTRLVAGLSPVLDYAHDKGVVIGFEPEPGMLIDTMTQFQRLVDRVDSPLLKLTLDIGHLHCLGEVPIADQIQQWAELIVNVHLEDMVSGVHDHLMFGDGEIEFPPVIAALSAIGYPGGVHVELSRHSHDAARTAAAAFAFLQPIVLAN